MLLKVKKLQRTNLQVILWWELRRFLYNGVLFVLITLSLELLKIHMLTLEMGTGAYFIFLSFIGFAFVMNFIYTFGWVVELFRQRSLTYAPRLFRFFSIVTFTLLAIYVCGHYLLIW